MANFVHKKRYFNAIVIEWSAQHSKEILFHETQTTVSKTLESEVADGQVMMLLVVVIS